MALHSSPAFGQADLSNCEREQIHLAGSIQPHGALLVVSEPDHVVVQASVNAADFLRLDDDVLGSRLEDLCNNLSASVRPHLSDDLHAIPMAVRCRAGRDRDAFDGLLHRPPGGGLVIELERAGPRVALQQHVESALDTIVGASALRGLCDDTARIFKDLTGYDRVMVYRFDRDGHGEVFSEWHEPGLEPYLGNRYPASDIPQIARRLYERNRVRVLADVEYQPVPLAPTTSPITGQGLDMSLCFLRSMSPIHVQYLKNMGVAATLVASLMVGGRLWGLIACHHYQPRFVHYEIRAVCELLAEIVATRIAALESFVQAQAELSVRRLEQRMVEAIAAEGDWRSALFDSSRALLQPLDATGAALLFEQQVLTVGDVPGTRELRAIGSWLDGQERSGPIMTTSLGSETPEFEPLTAVASGLLAVPVSTGPGEYLVWFRPEQVRTVTWAGNPHKAVVVGEDPSDLSPRRSFAQWHQLVEGTSQPWSPADVSAARLIGSTVADVILQFRSVRTLIAQDQLTSVSRQVERSEQPVIVADYTGRILLINHAFERLLPEDHHHLAELDDLVSCFADPEGVRRALDEMLRGRHAWRGQAVLRGETGSDVPLQVRADPVFSSPDRILGYVLLFTDLTESREVEAARRRFQQGIIERHRVMTVPLDSQGDLVYRKLLSSVVGNAQLAALEITDGVDVARMPEMLESVRVSVTRTAELLEHLVWHATRAPDDS